MTCRNSTEDNYEELASRENHGIWVSLLWNRASDRVKVAVYDASIDASFDVAVGEESPLDVFHHPFAYAAAASITIGAPTVSTAGAAICGGSGSCSRAA